MSNLTTTQENRIKEKLRDILNSNIFNEDFNEDIDAIHLFVEIRDFIFTTIDEVLAEKAEEIEEKLKNWNPQQWDEQSLDEMKKDILPLINLKNI